MHRTAYAVILFFFFFRLTSLTDGVGQKRSSERILCGSKIAAAIWMRRNVVCDSVFPHILSAASSCPQNRTNPSQNNDTGSIIRIYTARRPAIAVFYRYFYYSRRDGNSIFPCFLRSYLTAYTRRLANNNIRECNNNNAI